MTDVELVVCTVPKKEAGTLLPPENGKQLLGVKRVQEKEKRRSSMQAPPPPPPHPPPGGEVGA